MLRQINEQVPPNYDEMCRALRQGEVLSKEVDEVLRLEELHAFARRLPVWPTNTQIVMQVALSVAVPLVLLVLQFVVQALMEKAK